MVFALLAGGSQTANLNVPRTQNASMSNADNEADPAVTAVNEDDAAGGGGAAVAQTAPRSTSPTPRIEESLVDHLSDCVAKGKVVPGLQQRLAVW